eukprot:scaffold38715_cov31-Tisochrysis_lutea.AAC.2
MELPALRKRPSFSVEDGAARPTDGRAAAQAPGTRDDPVTEAAGTGSAGSESPVPSPEVSPACAAESASRDSTTQRAGSPRSAARSSRKLKAPRGIFTV